MSLERIEREVSNKPLDQVLVVYLPAWAGWQVTYVKDGKDYTVNIPKSVTEENKIDDHDMARKFADDFMTGKGKDPMLEIDSNHRKIKGDRPFTGQSSLGVSAVGCDRACVVTTRCTGACH